MQFEQLKIHPVISDNQTHRLNFISGRHLSEQEFDLMQRYVDERCEDLLLSMHPGIVQGLDVSFREDQPEFPIQINPGLAVSWSGRAIGSRFPIRFRWEDLRKNYRAEQFIDGQITDGFYFLTLRRGVVIVDEETDDDPCVRTEADPLRDSRLETIAQLNLQYIPVASSLMEFSRQRACMRILKKMLKPELFSQNPHEVKIAIVKIKDNKMLWLDVKAARFMARENTVYQTLLDYWITIVKSPTSFRLDATDPIDLDPAHSLNQILGVDFLPAAGQFPEKLIENIPGKQNSSTPALWERPRLKFNPDGLQIEIVPVPANSVNGVIKEELNRGVVDLLNGEADRIRLMVAVNPDNYHPRLMDLPEIDQDLIDDLKLRQQHAVDAYEAWGKQYYKIYENLDAVAAFEGSSNIPTQKTIETFSNFYLTLAPKASFTLINNDAKRKALNIPAEIDPPHSVNKILNDMVSARRSKLKTGEELPRPYSLHDTASEVTTTENLKSGTDGLYKKRIEIKEDIEEIEDYILRSNQVIDELRDYLSLQRQQLDSITVSFATLAGGIPGDGTGLKLMRWADGLTFTPKKSTT
jgi:hypothetical protein